MPLYIEEAKLKYLQLTSDMPQYEGIYYRKIGKGPAVVLLHGFPDSGAAWGGISAELSAHCTLIIPDMPGSGRSHLEKETLLPEMADGMKRVLDAEGIGKVVIAGHSMGGYIALAFAKSYPEMVAGLSLVHSTPLADDEEKKKNRLKAIDIIRNGGKEAFIKQMTANLFAKRFRETHPEIVRQKAIEGAEVADEGLINFYRAMIAREDTTGIVRNAVFPVQWILGSEDNVISYKRVLMECHHSPVNFVTLFQGCGHMSMIEARQMLVDDLKEFTNYCHCLTYT